MTAQTEQAPKAGAKVLRAGLAALVAGLVLAAVLAGVDVAAGPGGYSGEALGTLVVRVLIWGGVAAVVAVFAARALSRR